ncbi:uncharacterized protein J4E88_002753 [Alternaria novae-zelandiae]|uniref:uncharacterized protein n=1 Tax=Alternaria novae-zelandiae TaxID=430562 RepID=UPI0020C4DEC7|nr:uncharacterized protein J4E88_002753 [Alternaria novae-zelandiae]KAI4689401.1 hypothetical protein J4E88_002753 [Alternaria novae-zelandiae]
MTNNDNVRDVGAVYSQAEFSSAPTFLLMDKQSPSNNDDIMSIMICVESIECNFWKTKKQKNKDCGGSMSDEEAAFTVGCGDVHKLPLPLTGTYGSYKCQHVHLNTYESSSTVRVETTPHDPNNDVLVNPASVD